MSVDSLREVAWKTLHGWLREKIPQSAEGEKKSAKTPSSKLRSLTSAFNREISGKTSRLEIHKYCQQVTMLNAQSHICTLYGTFQYLWQQDFVTTEPIPQLSRHLA